MIYNSKRIYNKELNIVENFRPVSIPLVTVDPFFSIWSFNDKLYEDTTKFWTGKRAAMTGILEHSC